MDYFKNIITYKKYKKIIKIFSLFSQTWKYNINDDDVLSDNKFSLGGRWLRGFDSLGQAKEFKNVVVVIICF